MQQKRMECFRLLFDHLAWIEHQFLSGIGDSRKARSLWRMMRGVGGIRKSIHQSWLAKGLKLGLDLGLLCWSFKGVQGDIPSEEASTLQIGSVAFPPGMVWRYTQFLLHVEPSSMRICRPSEFQNFIVGFLLSRTASSLWTKRLSAWFTFMNKGIYTSIGN